MPADHLKERRHLRILKDRMSNKKSSMMSGDADNLHRRSTADHTGEANLLCFTSVADYNKKRTFLSHFVARFVKVTRVSNHSSQSQLNFEFMLDCKQLR